MWTETPFTLATTNHSKRQALATKQSQGAHKAIKPVSPPRLQPSLLHPPNIRQKLFPLADQPHHPPPPSHYTYEFIYMSWRLAAMKSGESLSVYPTFHAKGSLRANAKMTVALGKNKRPIFPWLDTPLCPVSIHCCLPFTCTLSVFDTAPQLWVFIEASKWKSDSSFFSSSNLQVHCLWAISPHLRCFWESSHIFAAFEDRLTFLTAFWWSSFILATSSYLIKLLIILFCFVIHLRSPSSFIISTPASSISSSYITELHHTHSEDRTSISSPEDGDVVEEEGPASVSLILL